MGDITIQAQDIRINEARETRRSETKTEFEQSGLTLALTSPVISAVQSWKPLNADGTAGPSGNMQTQMTDKWIESAIGRLSKGTPAQQEAAAQIKAALDNKTLVKIVAGVDSSGMTMIKPTFAKPE